ncbi:ion transporter [Goodfellowiella coeruleoviolacea]|uniref:ion transporter n=1 Tax=Goodfellowiella coeruleoviolacea TaxID=334858 RepID=UPI0020A40EA9|nr:ion transporter [Goodfellowiella coeruleoviolacea]
MSPRERVRVVVDAPLFQKLITLVIVVNAITLGCETSPVLTQRYGGLLHVVDRVALVIFVVEVAARVYAHGRRFFRDPWNWFDTVIVGVAVLPTSGSFGVLRALRILRALRLISVVPSMRRVVAALLAAVPGMASIAALLVLVLYVSAVIATKLFHTSAPEHFNDLGSSLFTLFQVMTGEAWSEVARTVMTEQPLAWIFFVTFIVITTFTVLNLFIAVAVSAMEDQVTREQARHERQEATANAAILDELRALRLEVRSLRERHQEPVQ